MNDFQSQTHGSECINKIEIKNYLFIRCLTEIKYRVKIIIYFLVKSDEIRNTKIVSM